MIRDILTLIFVALLGLFLGAVFHEADMAREYYKTGVVHGWIWDFNK